MSETHVVSALRDKRAELSGTIQALEATLGQHRANLLHLDATLRLFAPEVEPEDIPGKRPVVRNNFFRPSECVRLTLDLLRDAPVPLSTPNWWTISCGRRECRRVIGAYPPSGDEDRPCRPQPGCRRTRGGTSERPDPLADQAAMILTPRLN